MLKFNPIICAMLALIGTAGLTTDSSAANKAITAVATPSLPQPTSITPVESTVIAPPAPSQLLTQAYDAYKTEPNAVTWAEVMRQFKQLIALPGLQKVPSAAIIKSNPVLSDMGVRALDAGTGRLWTFTKIQANHEAVLQWTNTKSTVTYTGRRHKIKHVSTSVSHHMGSLLVPPTISLKEARLVGGAEPSRFLVLVGEEHGSNLWLQAYGNVDGVWTANPSHFDSIPTFLKEHVSGKVSFRGQDLIFNVGRVVPGKVKGTESNLPEAESSTYRFLVRLTEAGYVLAPHLPNAQNFGIVRTFLEAIAGNRTDQAKSYITDAKLLSIPRYVGMRGPNPNFRVAELAMPPSGASRFRIITGGKTDLIFEVAKVKERQLIRAIFIAPPDSFVSEITAHLPTFDKVAPPPPAPTDQLTAEPAKH